MKRLNVGSNLVEYAMGGGIVALVVGFSVFGIMKDGTLTNLTVNSGAFELKDKTLVSKYSNYKDGISSTQIDKVGTVDNPVLSCSASACNIDFGDYSLKGVTSNFNELVETTGVSSATDHIADLLAQMAEALKDQGDTQGYEDMKTLSNLGHNLGVLQDEMRRILDECGTDTACFDTYRYQTVPKPAGYDDTYTPFPSMTYADLSEFGDLGTIQDCEVAAPRSDPYCDNLSSNAFYNLNKTYLNTLGKITSSTTVPDSMKGVAEELAWDIGTVSTTFSKDYALLIGKYVGYRVADPITGEYISYHNLGEEDNATHVKTYKADEVTHFDSALVCASGKHKDPGKKCH